MRSPPSRLRAARERCGLTIRQLHDQTGIATGRLSMLERDMVRPHPAEELVLATVLASPATELFPPPSAVLEAVKLTPVPAPFRTPWPFDP